jgi:hypothetical protein
MTVAKRRKAVLERYSGNNNINVELPEGQHLEEEEDNHRQQQQQQQQGPDVPQRQEQQGRSDGDKEVDNCSLQSASSSLLSLSEMGGSAASDDLDDDDEFEDLSVGNSEMDDDSLTLEQAEASEHLERKIRNSIVTSMFGEVASRWAFIIIWHMFWYPKILVGRLGRKIYQTVTRGGRGNNEDNSVNLADLPGLDLDDPQASSTALGKSVGGLGPSGLEGTAIAGGTTTTTAQTSIAGPMATGAAQSAAGATAAGASSAAVAAEAAGLVASTSIVSTITGAVAGAGLATQVGVAVGVAAIAAGATAFVMAGDHIFNSTSTTINESPFLQNKDAFLLDNNIAFVPPYCSAEDTLKQGQIEIQIQGNRAAEKALPVFQSDLEVLFRDIYNNLSGMCLDKYSRVLHDATLDGWKTLEDSNAAAADIIVNTYWSALASCSGCSGAYS